MSSPATTCRDLPRSERPYRGITWRDMPGDNTEDKRMNFTLFRHGEYHLGPKCQGLQGAALAARLKELTSHQRANGGKGGGAWRKQRRE